jgi:hypothetical protein
VALAFRNTRRERVVAGVALVVMVVASVGAQVEGALVSAEMHRVRPGDAELFRWLNAHTPVDAVVATDNLRLSVLMPTMSHDNVLYANGSRSQATNDELMDRFLLASHLAGTSRKLVQERLQVGSEYADGALPVSTYLYYLSETSPLQPAGQHFLLPQFVPGVMQQFDEVNAATELKKFRVDYVWTDDGRVPLQVEGYELQPVFENGDGRLWELRAVK